MNRRQFIKTAIFTLGFIACPQLPAPFAPRQSWVDNAITLYLRTPDSELLEFGISFNGHPIETYVVKMFQENGKFIHEIKIPNIYNIPGKFETYYESENGQCDSDLSLTDEGGKSFRTLQKSDIIFLKRTVPAGKFAKVNSPIRIFSEA